jgi:methyl-accepting chemotaxis protein
MADRIGIVARLLASSLLAMIVALAAVEVWTLRAVEKEEMARAQASLAVNMAALKHDLARLGDTWSIADDGRLQLGSTTLNGRNDLVDNIRDITGGAATIFAGDTRIATNVRNPDGSRAIGTHLVHGAAYDAVLRDGRSYQGPATILGAPYLTFYEAIRDARGASIGILFVGVPTAEAEAFMRRIVVETMIGSLALAFLVGLVFFMVLRVTVRPVTDLAGIMHRIAEGFLDCTVPYAARTDQIGKMARALVLLRDTSAHARALEQDAAASRTASEAGKAAALQGMADQVETETRAAMARIRERTAAMASTADAMNASAARTSTAATTAANAAGLALANAQAVAGAAEQLTASIREINRQMAQSAAVVNRAVTAGAETRTTIEALNQEVERIGAVAVMIGDIAGKTNLLALNATIEAARAGEAGKGFAVVATEVKALASQTARSTDEIGRHIARVRGATEASVAAVGQIEQTITAINAIASSIAAAVEQQGAATAEIARAVAETATAANEMTSRAEDVTGEASETGGHATEVRENATGLHTAMEDLRHSVIRSVRTATAEVNRRGDLRLEKDLPCKLTVGGQS